MKNKVTYIALLFLLPLLLACGGNSDKLETLLARKKALKSELADVQQQINALEAESSHAGTPLVSLAPIEQKQFEHKIIVQGTVETDQDILLNAEFGGLITQVHVSEGQSVSVGQVLVSLDADMISSSMEELETQLSYAQYVLDKQSELKKRGVGTEMEYKTAKNQVDAIKSKMKSLGTQRGKSSIKAPFSGVVDKIFAKNGQIAGPQSPLLRLVNNSEINITADISEKHLENIKTGTLVRVRFPNFRDTSVQLQITHVGNYIDPTNRTFRIIANMKNNRVFLPNMLAELEITDISIPNAMVVPSRSVLKSQQNEDYVYLAVKGKQNTYTTKRVNVKLMQKYKNEAHVICTSQDFKKGAKVVVDGAKGVTDKEIVQSN